MRLGFIGVGYMGRHMARNLAGGGHDLTIFDIRKEAAEELISMGSSWADSPGSVAERSEVVFTSLPRPQDVEEAATGEGGVLSGAARGTVLFDLSTTDPDTIHRIADVASARGVEVLDAPVSGGTGGAENATLCIMVGGDRSTYERHKPVLDLASLRTLFDKLGESIQELAEAAADPSEEGTAEAPKQKNGLTATTSAEQLVTSEDAVRTAIREGMSPKDAYIKYRKF